MGVWPDRRDARSSEVGQYRADRSTRRYQDSSVAVWDTLRLADMALSRGPLLAVACSGWLART